jgi:2'-hydroxyisoflavone reductase
LQVRAGLIVGPFDPTGRFTYWVTRIARGGEVLAPAPGQAPVQFIDARDLADWTLRMVTGGGPGVFNVTGPSQRFTMEDLLEECARSSGSRAQFTWVDPDFLLEHKVEPWSELPLWLPEDHAMLEADIGKVMGAGLRLRPVGDTIRDVLEWSQISKELPGAAGMDPEREAAILRQWRSAS